MRYVKLVIVLSITGLMLITGCAKRTKIPDIDVSRLDAEQSLMRAQAEIDDARKAGADVSEPVEMLDSAKGYMINKKFSKAKSEADNATRLARRLKEEALAGTRTREDAEAAIRRASEKIETARVLGGDVTEPESILAASNTKFDEEDYSTSIELADKAYDMAVKIIDYLKMDKYIVGNWSIDRDCLWNIAGKKAIYNDSWKWKRIYLANREKIRNPDLIYPKQVLKIPRN
ncbi:MAG: hypothetical protein ABIH89_11045 [Elusimicrobiota bacterium]